ncbi:hypothetical protein CYMTET_27060 [Cymbomonas tetramitiformis]|uniref:C3H1-type domain-containing protein n=1 Tax=Cymbomonas tetramitiformis TaxID=36881 RepID=A0AAE0KXJ0_9CHLO|nr:hypothetical protein CYMTET_27060 [Cymbomonas tetramitiformis]
MEYLELMLQSGAHTDTFVDHSCKTREHVDWSYTALHAACRKGHADCVYLLMRAHADPTLLDTWTDRSNGEEAVRQPCVDLEDVPPRCTALMWAVACGHLDCIDALLASDAGHYALHAVGESGVTPLMVAARRRQLDAAVRLLQYGCSLGSAEKNDGYERFLRLAQQRAGRLRLTHTVPAVGAKPTCKADVAAREAADRAMYELLATEEVEKARVATKARRRAARKKARAEKKSARPADPRTDACGQQDLEDEEDGEEGPSLEEDESHPPEEGRAEGQASTLAAHGSTQQAMEDDDVGVAGDAATASPKRQRGGARDGMKETMDFDKALVQKATDVSTRVEGAGEVPAPALAPAPAPRKAVAPRKAYYCLPVDGGQMPLGCPGCQCCSQGTGAAAEAGLPCATSPQGTRHGAREVKSAAKDREDAETSRRHMGDVGAGGEAEGFTKGGEAGAHPISPSSIEAAAGTSEEKGAQGKVLLSPQEARQGSSDGRKARGAVATTPAHAHSSTNGAAASRVLVMPTLAGMPQGSMAQAEVPASVEAPGRDGTALARVTSQTSAQAQAQAAIQMLPQPQEQARAQPQEQTRAQPQEQTRAQPQEQTRAQPQEQTRAHLEAEALAISGLDGAPPNEGLGYAAQPPYSLASASSQPPAPINYPTPSLEPTSLPPSAYPLPMRVPSTLQVPEVGFSGGMPSWGGIPAQPAGWPPIRSSELMLSLQPEPDPAGPATLRGSSPKMAHGGLSPTGVLSPESPAPCLSPPGALPPGWPAHAPPTMTGFGLNSETVACNPVFGGYPPGGQVGAVGPLARLGPGATAVPCPLLFRPLESQAAPPAVAPQGVDGVVWGSGNGNRGYGGAIPLPSTTPPAPPSLALPVRAANEGFGGPLPYPAARVDASMAAPMQDAGGGPEIPFSTGFGASGVLGRGVFTAGANLQLGGSPMWAPPLGGDSHMRATVLAAAQHAWSTPSVVAHPPQSPPPSTMVELAAPRSLSAAEEEPAHLVAAAVAEGVLELPEAPLQGGAPEPTTPVALRERSWGSRGELAKVDAYITPPPCRSVGNSGGFRDGRAERGPAARGERGVAHWDMSTWETAGAVPKGGDDVEAATALLEVEQRFEQQCKLLVTGDLSPNTPLGNALGTASPWPSSAGSNTGGIASSGSSSKKSDEEGSTTRPTRAEAAKMVCRYLARGHCPYGSRCWFMHRASSSAANGALPNGQSPPGAVSMRSPPKARTRVSSKNASRPQSSSVRRAIWQPRDGSVSIDGGKENQHFAETAATPLGVAA